MNNKGFTLIELIATIFLLALIMSISTFAIISIINASKENNYNVLISNIKSAVETYRMECKYSSNTSSNIECKNTLTLGELVKYGYLTGNSKDETNEYSLINPKDDNQISDCQITYTYSNGEITITAVNPTDSCPTEY